MITPVNPFPVDHRAYSNITPFTVRDNATVIQVIEEMRKYITKTLIPFINTNIGNLDESWTKLTQELIESWNMQSAALIEQVEAIASEASSAEAAAEAAKAAAEAAAELAEQFASQAQDVQDAALTTIFNDLSSQFREAFNVAVENLIIEDPEDEGTFIFNPPPQPPEPGGGVVPDPTDPGFFV